MSAVTINGPSSALWTTSLPYRIAVDPSDPGRHAYFTTLAHAVAYLDRNFYLERVVELSPRYALSPSEEHKTDEPSVDSLCDGCGCSGEACAAIKAPAIKCCPDCSHADRTRVEVGRDPTAGNVAAYDYADGVLGEQ